MMTPHLYPQRTLRLPSFLPALGEWMGSREEAKNKPDNQSGHHQNLTYQIQQTAKRVFDLVATILGVMLISPLLLLIALLIKVSSRGPVLYQSLRIGQDYRPFLMYKFRTMVVDADAQREALRAEAGLAGQLFKLENDPRITPIGKVLRALSLDELPQLFNVLRGEMSLVGPRPLPPDESEMFDDPYTLRFNVKPGITGLWQVSGRSSLKFEQLRVLEMNYVLQWNFLADIGILFRTVPAVLMSRGAY